MRFTVRGTPVPQGSIRHLGKGRPSVHANADKLLPWRNHVQIEAERALDGAPPLEGPVSVEMVFTVPKPKSAPKRKLTWPTKRPDLDHLVRACADACTAAGVWRDDSQITALVALKVYPSEHPQALDVPGVTVEAWNVPSEPLYADLTGSRAMSGVTQPGNLGGLL